MTPETKNLLRALSPFILLFLLFYFPLHSTFLHRKLVGIISQTTGWKTDFRRSQFSLLTGQLSLHDVRIEDPKQSLALRLKRLKVGLSPRSLLRGKVILSRVVLDEPEIEIKYFPQKKATLGPEKDIVQKFFDLFEESAFLQNTILEKVLVKSPSILLPSSASKWKAEELFVSLRPTLTQEIRITFRVRSVSHQKNLLDLLETDLNLSRDTCEIQKFLLQKEDFVLEASGLGKGNLLMGTFAFQGQFFPKKVLPQPVQFDGFLQIQQNIAQIKELRATLGEAHFKSEGAIHLRNKTYALQFQAEELPLESIFQKLPGPILSPSRGIANVAGRADGKLPQLSANAKATIRNFRHQALAASKADGELSLRWPELSFKAALEIQEGGPETGSVHGSVHFKPLQEGGKIKALPQKIGLTFQEAPLEAILPNKKIFGKLSGHLNLEGVETSVQGKGEGFVRQAFLGPLPIESLRTKIKIEKEGHFQFHETVLEFPSLEPILWPRSLHLSSSQGLLKIEGAPSPTVDFKGTYESATQQLKIASLKWRSAAGTFLLQGIVSNQLALEATGDLNLTFLRIFRAQIAESAGTAKVHLKANGPVENPNLEGEALLKNVLIELMSLKETISGLSGQIKIHQQSLTSNLTGRLAQGPFSLKGNLELDRVKPAFWDLSLEGYDFPIHLGQEMQLEVNGKVTLKGPASSPTLSGKVDVLEGHYKKEFEIREFVLKPVTGKKKEKKKSAFLENLKLNLEMKSTGDLLIKNNVATLLLAADLKIRGPATSPQIEGVLTLVEGTFHYLRTDFTLTEGRLEFLDPDRNEPYLILRGERDIPPDYLVSLKIEGYLNNLAISLQSIPSQSREDILSLIAFGVTRDQLEREGGLGKSLGQEVAFSQAARPIQGLVSKTTGLDLQLQPTAGELGTSGVAVASEVTDRLSLELKTDLAPETAEQVFQANYYLTDNVLLKGFRARKESSRPHYQFNLSLRFQIR